MTDKPAPAIRKKLLAWYGRHARDLPWRRSRDPYAVFLSEIMLQQTRVETVIPYFERFLSRFPTVERLAAASTDEVLGLWSGLGYYRRARSLHLAAREVTERYGGRFPADRSSLEGLPGIGAYTAGAVASIAFELEEPLVDGNVARVLSRIFALDAQLGSKESNASLWSLAATLVKGPAPGDFNQSLMELGATVCLPGEPRCGECPVRAECRAHTLGRTAELPVAKAKKAPRDVALTALVAGDPEKGILLAKRSLDGLFGGLWEPPMWSADSAAPKGFAVLVKESEPAGVVSHTLTHRALSVSVLRSPRTPRALPEPPPGYVELAVHPLESGLGLSTLAKKLVRAAGSGAESPGRARVKKKPVVSSPKAR